MPSTAYCRPSGGRIRDERLPHGDVLQLADERAAEIDGSGTMLRLVPRTSRSSSSVIGDRLREGQRERPIIEVRGQRVLVELRERQRRHRPRRLLRGGGSCRQHEPADGQHAQRHAFHVHNFGSDRRFR